MTIDLIHQLADKETQEFIFKNADTDERQLVLSKSEVNGISSKIIASQLSGRKKCKTKLPTWYTTPGIVYPPALNLEQSSSEATGIFKQQIIDKLFDPSIRQKAVDLSGGFGVDSLFLSRIFHQLVYVEPDEKLIEIVRHNHQLFGAKNITYRNQTAEGFLENSTDPFNLIYIDPSRRDEKSNKVFQLKDCIPDITSLHPSLFTFTNFLLLKASPLLDIQQGLREIPFVKNVWVVSVDNECKEVLFLAEKNFTKEPLVEAVELTRGGSVKDSFSFYVSDETKADVTFGAPANYLYEPNASILKAGAFKLLANKFEVSKLENNTHLYTSTELIKGFPGRVFQLDQLNPDKKSLNALPGKKVNIITRNYPLTPEQIKHKYQLQDGGDKFLLGFSSQKKRCLALCSRIKGI